MERIYTITSVVLFSSGILLKRNELHLKTKIVKTGRLGKRVCVCAVVHVTLFFSSFVFELKPCAVGVLFGPFVEARRQLLGHVVFPVSDLAFTNELNVLISYAVQLQIRFDVDGWILLHSIKFQMVTHVGDILIGDDLLDAQKFRARIDGGWQVFFHVFILEKQDVRLVSHIPKG